MSFESRLLDAMCDALGKGNPEEVSKFCRSLIQIASEENATRMNAQENQAVDSRMLECARAQQFEVENKIIDFEQVVNSIRRSVVTTPHESLYAYNALLAAVDKFLKEVGHGTDNKF